jgi:hypothetical protein
MIDEGPETPTNNGHHPAQGTTRGRTPPALPTFTFRDSGITVAYRRLGPFTLDQLNKTIRKERPAPEPPLNTVDFGDGKPVAEPNLADPDYERARAEYETWVQGEAGQRLVEMVITYAVEPLTIDAAAVAQYRSMAERFGLLCEGDDRDVYVRYVAITTQEDLQEIVQTVVSRSQPTGEAIQAAVASFPANVPGA